MSRESIWARVAAIVLSVTLVAGLIPTGALAEVLPEGDTDAVVAAEEQPGTENVTDDADVQEPKEDASEQEPEEAGEAQSQQADDGEQKPAEVTTPEASKPELAKRTITDKTGVVTVSGKLPEGVTVTARKMTDEEAKALAPEGVSVHAAYDITLWLDGEEYQPEGDVTVKIGVPDLPSEGVEVRHIETDESGDAVDSETLAPKVTDEGVSFTTDGFSPFLVTSGAKASTEDCSFDVKWSDAADNAHSYAEDGTLILTPNNSDANYKATMTVSFKYNAREDQFLDAGSVQIKIPYTPFVDWHGGNKVAITSNSNSWPAIVPPVQWQVPKAPATATTSSFNYQISDDGKYLIVTNYQQIQGGKTLSFDVGYLFRPTGVKVEPVYDENNKLLDYSRYQNDDVHAELYVNDEKTDEGSLALEYRAQPGNPRVNKSQRDAVDSHAGQFLTWQDSWGEPPADADDYFYVIWNVKYQEATYGKHATMPFDIKLLEKDNVVNVGTEEDPQLRTIPAEDCVVGIHYYSSDWQGIHHEGFGHQDNTPSGSIDPSYPNIAGADESYQVDVVPASDITKGWQETDYFQVGYYVVLTRYPKALLYEAKANGVDIAENGLRITNTVGMDHIFADGTTRPAALDMKNSNLSSTTFFRVQLGAGTGYSVAKSYDLGTNANNRILPGARTTLLEQDRPVSLRYQMTYNYGMISSIGDKINPYTATADDYQIRIARTKDNNNNWNSRVASSEVIAQDGDYYFKNVALRFVSEYEGKYVELGDGTAAWEAGSSRAYEDRDPIELWVRLEGSDDFVLYGKVTVDAAGKYTFTRDGSFSGSGGIDSLANVSDSNRITLPDKVVQMRVSHKTDAYKGAIGMNFTIQLNASNHVKEVLGGHEENYRSYPTYVTNDAKFHYHDEATGDEGESDCISTEIGRTFILNSMDSSTRVSKWSYGSTVVDEPTRARQYRTVEIKIDQGVKAPADYDLSDYKIHSGVFYDLLPAGTYVEESTIQVGSTNWNGFQISTSSSTQYTVEVIKNWNDTGRDLLIVDMSSFDRSWVSGNDRRYYSFGIHMRLYNTYDNIRDRGTNVNNAACFVDTDEDSPFKADNKITNLSPANQATMQQVVDEYGIDLDRAGFSQTTLSYSAVAITETGLEKTSSSSVNRSYQQEAEAYIGQDYTYRISYSQGESTQSRNVVLYDVLEKGSHLTADEPEWQGTIQSVDCSSIILKPNNDDRTATCAPVVYYATQDPGNADLTDPVWQRGTLNSSGVWAHENPKTVKAFAIDCRYDSKGNPFTLEPGTPLNAFVHMIAPNDKGLDGKKAVNEVRVTMDLKGSGGNWITERSNDTFSKVTLLDPKLELHKTSSPESGTEDAPTMVWQGDTVYYILPVSVAEDAKYNLNNVKVEDQIPAGLTVKTSDIRYYTDSNATLQTLGANKAAQVANADGKLTFTIPTLAKGSTIYLRIPAKVDQLAEGEVSKVFVNQAKITSYNGSPADIPSETTYHEVDTYKLTYHVSDDATWGRPADATVPPAVTGIVHGGNVTLDPKSSTTQTYAENSNHEHVPGTWTFTGWKDDQNLSGDDITEKTNITQDEDVYGKWTFTPDTYKLTYHVADDPAWGKPDESVTPAQVKDIDFGEDVTLADKLTTQQGTAKRTSDNEDVPGTWKFTGWKATEGLSGDDITKKEHVTKDEDVYGKWEFTPTKYHVTYEVQEDDTWGQPDDSVTPTDGTAYDWKDDVDVAERLTTQQGFAKNKDGEEVPGTWTFSPWTSDNTGFDEDGFKITEDTKITGKWTFTPDTYTLTYHVADDPAWGKPDDSVTPAQVKDIDFGDDVTLENPLTTSDTTAIRTSDGEDVPGTWKFTGWKATEGLTGDDITKKEHVTKDENVYGKWEFTPTKYHVTYEVKEDDTWGQPDDSVTPTDDNEYDWKDDVDVADRLTTTQDYAENPSDPTDHVPGTWTFSPWTSDNTGFDEDGFKITEDTKITGTWTFTPTTYDVEYEVQPDPTWGQPEDSVTPTDDNVYDWRDPVDVADKPTTTQGYAKNADGDEVPGTWTFSEKWTSDNPDFDENGFEIKQDTKITGTWTFTPDTYTLTYHVAGDDEWGTPDDSIVPDQVTGIDFGGSVTLADKLTTMRGFALRNGKRVPGTWSFIGWKIDEALSGADIAVYENIRQDVDVFGKWVFDPDTASVSVKKVWDDNNYSKRPTSVTIHLLANGKDTGETLKLSAKNDWRGTFEGLQAYDENGDRITYTVSEDAVEGYETTITGSADEGFTVTNKHESDKPDNHKKRIPKTGDPTHGVATVAMLGLGLLLCGAWRSRREED